MRTKQYRHQLQEYTDHRGDAARAFFWQMRTGKTKQVIDEACWLHKAMEIDGVLVIAPNGVHRQWIDVELDKHMWHEKIIWTGFAWRFANKNNSVLSDIWMNAVKESNGILFSWLAINMESLIRDEVKRYIDKFLRNRRILVVYDECHHFSKAGAKRTGVARGIARRAAYRRILSGTPLEESPLGAFTQFELLDKGALGFATAAAFRARYAVYENQAMRGGRSYPRLVGYNNLEELRENMSRYVSVVMRSDCDDLPDIQEDLRVVELAPAQRKLWHDIKEKEIDALLQMRQQSALDAGAALVKLQQIEGGFWRHSDTEVEQVVPIGVNSKMLILTDEVSQYDGQVLVWFQFIHELEAAAEVLSSLTVGRFHGHAANRERDLGAFQRGRLRVMLAQPAAGGEGRDFSAAGKIVWYSQTPSARLYAQAAERATKIGGKKIQVIDLVAPGGVDARWRKMRMEKIERASGMTREGMREVLESLEI